MHYYIGRAFNQQRHQQNIFDWRHGQCRSHRDTVGVIFLLLFREKQLQISAGNTQWKVCTADINHD